MTETKNVAEQAIALVGQLAHVLASASHKDKQAVCAWLESNRGIDACARGKMDLRLSEFLLDLPSATLADHLRFCEQNGRLRKGKALETRLQRVVNDAKQIKGPRSLEQRLTATKGGAPTYKLYLRLARRIRWSTASGAPDWAEFTDWAHGAPTQEERKLHWVRELERHMPTKTDTAMRSLSEWPMLTKGDAGWSHTIPVWVRAHSAFARLDRDAHLGIDPYKTRNILYVLFVRAPTTPDPYVVQLYIGLAKNSADDRWSSHLDHVAALLQARGDTIALARLAKTTQVVDTCLALLAAQGRLLSDACLFVLSTHESEAAMMAAESALRRDVTLQVTHPCFGLNVV